MQGSGGDIVRAAAFEFTPAMVFGSAVAFAASTLLALPQLGAAPVAAGAAAFASALLALRRIGSERPQFRLQAFDVPSFEPQNRADDAIDGLVAALAQPRGTATSDAGELLLEDILDPPQAAAGELVLDEVLDAIDPDSRVVQLFRADASPTAGELHARIERHLRSAPPVVPDATHELREALAALRQSLR